MAKAKRLGLGTFLESEKGREIYKKHLQDARSEKDSERERLNQIADVRVGQEVTLVYGRHYQNTRQEKVLRVCAKTYKVSLGEDDYVLIGKESLHGFPNSIIKEITGDSRRYIGENIKMILQHGLNP